MATWPLSMRSDLDPSGACWETTTTPSNGLLRSQEVMDLTGGPERVVWLAQEVTDRTHIKARPARARKRKAVLFQAGTKPTLSTRDSFYVKTPAGPSADGWRPALWDAAGGRFRKIAERTQSEGQAIDSIGAGRVREGWLRAVPAAGRGSRGVDRLWRRPPGTGEMRPYRASIGRASGRGRGTIAVV